MQYPARCIVATLACIGVLGAPAAAYGSGAQYVVAGRPLVAGKQRAGRTIVVFTRPVVVSVGGCRSSRARVRVGASTRITASVRCAGRRGAIALVGEIRGGVLRGTFGAGATARRFTGRAKVVPGAVLRGRAPARASTAVVDVDRAIRHTGDDVERNGMVRTELVATFAASATVGRVNAALAAAGARIVESLPQDLRVLVAIPDPGSRAGLDAVAALLRRQPGVVAVAESALVAPASLPPGMAAPLPTKQDNAIQHLIAIGMPAAWNARAALDLASQPTVLVLDFFGAGAVSSQVDADVTGDLGHIPNVPAESHGYHVVGIVAANHADDGSLTGRITGAFPARSRMVAENLQQETNETANDRLLRLATATPGRLVVNTSLQNTLLDSLANARTGGAAWATRVRGAGLEGRLFNATAGGNHTNDSTRWADRNAAALRADLVPASGGPVVPPLTNTVVVENVTTAATPDHAPGCLEPSSNFDGTLAAPGTDIVSFDELDLPKALTGTSMATPLVAGLAEYLWTLAPDLSAPDLRNALRATASTPVAGCARFSRPIVDAYAAALSLDQTVIATPETAPIRLALLDRDDDGDFDEADLTQWADVLKRAGPVTARTFGRGDLNGDGFVGGTTTRPFDLDRVGSTRAGAASLSHSIGATVDGSNASFDETALTDAQIVCFYAYSALYTIPLPPAADNRKTLVDPATNCPLTPFSMRIADAQTTAYGLSFRTTPRPLGTRDEQGVVRALARSGADTDPQTGANGSVTATAPSIVAHVGDATLDATAQASATQNAAWTTDPATRALTLTIGGSSTATAGVSDTDPNDAEFSNTRALGSLQHHFRLRLTLPATYTLTTSLHSDSHVTGDAPHVTIICGATIVQDIQAASLAANVTGSLPAGDCDVDVRLTASADGATLTQTLFPTSAAGGSATLTLTPPA